MTGWSNITLIALLFAMMRQVWCSEGCCVAVWKERELHKRELNYFLRSRRANHIIIFRRICSSRSANGQHKMMVSTVLSLYLHRRKCVPRLLDFANRVSLNRGRRVGSLHSSLQVSASTGFLKWPVICGRGLLAWSWTCPRSFIRSCWYSRG